MLSGLKERLLGAGSYESEPRFDSKGERFDTYFSPSKLESQTFIEQKQTIFTDVGTAIPNHYSTNLGTDGDGASIFK